MSLKKLAAFFLFLFIFLQVRSQTTQRVDTIDLARSIAYEKKFSAADSLLGHYNKDNNDINGLRLHAQVLYWMKAFDRSIAVYEKALALFPHEKIVHLEYGRILFNLNKMTKARQFLDTYVKHDSLNAEANILLSYIDFWQGHIQAAKKRSLFLLQHYPGNAEAQDILKQIRYNTSPYLKTGIDFLSDDQPRDGVNYTIEGGVYKSWFFSPVLQATIYQFNATDSIYNSSWFRIKNTIQGASGFSLVFGGGLFHHGAARSTHVTGSVEAAQVIAKRFSLNAGYEKKPYQYTIASLKNMVLEAVSSFSLSYNKNDKWLGKSGYESHHFKDDNKVNTFYFWLLAPLLHKNGFSLKGGYAYSYAHADKNNLIPGQPLNKIISSTALHGPVQGMYDPYFTPQNQMIHSLLASIRIGLSKTASFASRASISISATADNPGLTLEKKANQFYIEKKYETTKYNPSTWVSELQVGLSKKFFISANYTLEHLLFYTNNQGGIQLKYLFLK